MFSAFRDRRCQVYNLWKSVHIKVLKCLSVEKNQKTQFNYCNLIYRVVLWKQVSSRSVRFLLDICSVFTDETLLIRWVTVLLKQRFCQYLWNGNLTCSPSKVSYNHSIQIYNLAVQFVPLKLIFIWISNFSIFVYKHSPLFVR